VPGKPTGLSEPLNEQAVVTRDLIKHRSNHKSKCRPIKLSNAAKEGLEQVRFLKEDF